MKITLELLKEKGACEDSIRWFDRVFPNGCVLNDKNIGIAKDNNCPPAYAWWVYNT